NSGRIGTMIFGVLSLFAFPLGTLYGFFKLYILTRPEVEALFTGIPLEEKTPQYYYPVTA
ncbi:MAG: hypothetical protein ACFFBD_15425, partial [Candidatus Hodarchaeota archaeon]